MSNSDASEAKSSSSSGRIFSRTSLTLTSKTASSPARCSAWYSSGKVTSTLRSSPASAPVELLLEALDQLAAAELEQVVARPRRPRTPCRRPCPRSRSAARRPRRPARSTGSSPAKPSRIRSTSARRSRRGPRARRWPTSRPLYSPSSAFGRTPTSNVNASGSPSASGRSRRSRARVADRADAGVEQRPLVPLGQRLADRLLEHRAEADPLDHQRAAAPCPCGSRACASRGRAPSRRGRPASRTAAGFDRDARS